jgi:hypothetical protein
MASRIKAETRRLLPATITQEQLSAVGGLVARRHAVEAVARKIKDEEEEVWRVIRDLRKAGSAIEPGALTLVEKSLGRRPDWQAEFTKRLGEVEAARVRAATPEKSYLAVEPTAAPAPGPEPDASALADELEAAVAGWMDRRRGKEAKR